jgi:hypothetical protein
LQSLLVPVPAADPVVDPFRRKGDWSWGVGAPAHITLAGPFPLSEKLPVGPLVEVAGHAVGTRFRLDEFGRVGDAACLLLSDEGPLLELQRKVMETLGRTPRAGARRLHLTIGRRDSEAAFDRMRAEMESVLPVPCEVDDILVARLDNGRLEFVSLVRPAPASDSA